MSFRGDNDEAFTRAAAFVWDMVRDLDAAADAAAVAAVTSAMMQQSPQVAQTTAKNVFNITANTLVNNSNMAGQPPVTVAVNCSKPDSTTGYCTYFPCPIADSVYADGVNSNNQVVRWAVSL